MKQSTDGIKINNNFLARKFVTLLQILRQNGFAGAKQALLKNYYFCIQMLRLNKIARHVKSHLSQTTLSFERGKTLAEGIYYIIGSAVEGDVAEFGTMHANTAVALAASLGHISERMEGSELAHGFTNKRKLW